jgi:hypothetical protein
MNSSSQSLQRSDQNQFDHDNASDSNSFGGDDAEINIMMQMLTRMLVHSAIAFGYRGVAICSA